MILIAALRIQSDLLPNGECVLPCLRHGMGYIALKEFAPQVHQDPKRIITEGFITTKGKFLDRKEALKHAKKCNQLSQSTLWAMKDNDQQELYSEDLY